MKKIKAFVNKNYKVVIGIIIGITISIGIGVSALATKDITYDNSKSGLTSTNLQGAIDELNTKATTKIEEAKKECPEGYKCIKTNFMDAYTYNQTSGASNYCITGEESTCVETSCYKNKTSGSCPSGTIIKYAVNSNTTKYFHVLHDDGATMTLQQRENTVYTEERWNSNHENTEGPTTLLSLLNNATSGWTNVNDQTYTMGITNFNNTNFYTGCSSYNSCTQNIYTLGKRTGKARMITVQEAAAVGCTRSAQSCPIWMYNYLSDSTRYGGTVDDEATSSGVYNSSYSTMSASPNSYQYNNYYIDQIWVIKYLGYLDEHLISYPAEYNQIRAVVVVNK